MITKIRGRQIYVSESPISDDTNPSSSNLIFLITLAFLTLNINPGIGTFEYFPLITLLLVLASGTTSNLHLCIGALLLSISFFTGSIPENTEAFNFSNNIKIIAAILLFLFGGSAIIKYSNEIKKSCDIILFIHLIYSIIYITNPELVSLFQELAGLRGVMYEGKASFFSSEPSYAAINLMGAYILSLNNNEATPKKICKILIVIFCLILTKSVTGFAFAVGILLISLEIKHKIPTLVAIALMAISISATNDDSPISRISSIIESMPNEFDSSSIKEALNLIEPSGMWRHLVNSANLNIGLSSLLGTSSFSIISNLGNLDEHLKFLITNNPTYELLPDVLSQSIVPSFTVYSGVAGFVSISFTLGLSILGFIRSNTYNTRRNNLCIIYLLIGAFWQSSLTAPLWWIILSCGVFYFLKIQPKLIDKSEA